MEQRLSAVQGRKTKVIEALSNLRLEKAKIKGESVGSDTVDDWVVAVLENKAEDEVYEMLWQGMTDTQRENFAFLAC